MGRNDRQNTPPPTNDSARPDRKPASRLDAVVDTVREISLQTDPQAMVSNFRKRATKLFGGNGSVSLSRRDLKPPDYRITRSTQWEQSINPWTQTERLPLLCGGLLGELLYANEPRLMHDVSVDTRDPGYEYLRHARSLVSLPLFDGGVSLNMVVRMSSDPHLWDQASLAEQVLQANLFGRATSHLVLAHKLQAANAELDHEMKRVAQIQRSLLPASLPKIKGIDVAVSYKTATRAGGDYYDFFDLEDGRWGVLIADVSGHGSPAAVVMAILRTILHGQCKQAATPSEVLAFANASLSDQSDRFSGTFVTAFYGIYDPSDRSLHYASAGHNPPLLVDRETCVHELNEAQGLPLAVRTATDFPETSRKLAPGDTLLLYTDGITEATNNSGEQYGLARLLSCVREDASNAQHIIDCVTHKLLAFADGLNQQDDQTLLAMRIHAQ